MLQEIKTLVEEFRRQPLPAICALLIAAVSFLALQIFEYQKRREVLEEAYRKEIAEIERRCAADIDALRREQIATIQKALDNQSRIEQKIIELKKRR